MAQYHNPLRRTGRTTRMLFNAMSEAKSNREGLVIVSFQNQSEARANAHKVMDTLCTFSGNGYSVVRPRRCETVISSQWHADILFTTHENIENETRALTIGPIAIFSDHYRGINTK